MTKLPDYFVSFCLAQEGDLAAELDAISALAAFCGQRLQYWEIVYVVGECHRSAIQAAIDTFVTIKNLRIVLVRDAISYYRRRTIGVSEAIGDVVVLTSFNEMSKPTCWVCRGGLGAQSHRDRPQRRAEEASIHCLIGSSASFRAIAWMRAT